MNYTTDAYNDLDDDYDDNGYYDCEALAMSYRCTVPKIFRSEHSEQTCEQYASNVRADSEHEPVFTRKLGSHTIGLASD